MVRREERSESEKLDRLVEQVAKDHGLKLRVTGWTRKTYELYATARDPRDSHRLLRLESYAAHSGLIDVLSPKGLPAAEDLAARLEATFPGVEAVLREP